jgi:hypothetical protein
MDKKKKKGKPINPCLFINLLGQFIEGLVSNCSIQMDVKFYLHGRVDETCYHGEEEMLVEIRTYAGEGTVVEILEHLHTSPIPPLYSKHASINVVEEKKVKEKRVIFY